MITDVYDVVGQVLDIPLEQIREAPDNVRSDLGDLTDLAASITEVGVLQPITVIADPGGETFVVKTGHRRLAASKVAGRGSIRAIVDPTEADDMRVIEMLIENVHRKDLSPIDEARTYDRLISEFGISQRDLEQRVARSQSHISKRISLLDLPMKAREMLGRVDADGRLELTLEEAQELTKLSDAPERIKKILAATREQREWMIDEEVEDFQAEEAARIAREEIAKTGLTVIDPKAAADLSQVATESEWIYGKAIRFKQPKRHEKEPCHVVTVVGDRYRTKPEITPFCLEPARHTEKGDSKLKRLVESKRNGGPEKSTSQKNKERAAREAAKARKAFMADLVQNRTISDIGTDISQLVLDRYLADAAHNEILKMCELLGIELPKKGPKDPAKALTTYLADSARGGLTPDATAQLRACLAFALVQGEWTSTWSYGDSHHQILLDAGYEPSDLERKEWKLDKKTKTDDDPEDDTEDATPVADTSDERMRAEADALAALNRCVDRAIELDQSVDPTIEDLGDELELEETSTDRVIEITALLDVAFAELNNLHEDDVVDLADDGTHTIERAEPGTQVWHAYGDVANAGHTTMLRPLAADQAHAPETRLNDLTLQYLGSFEHKPAEIEVVELLKAAIASPNDSAGITTEDAQAAEQRAPEPAPGIVDKKKKKTKDCGQPGCLIGRDHLGDHKFAPKEETTGETLDGYVNPRPAGEYERKTRELILDLPADDPEVMKLQQELYRGVPVARLTGVNARLKTLKRERSKKASK